MGTPEEPRLSVPRGPAAAQDEYGGGYHGVARGAIPGQGPPSPHPPTMLSANKTDATDATLTWTADTGAAAWWVYQSSPPNGLNGPFTQLPYPIVPPLNLPCGCDSWTAGWLFQTPISQFAFKVQACNGSECTTLSNALAVTPLAAGAAMRPLAPRPLATRPRTPGQMATQASFGRPVTPAQAAAQAMPHRQPYAGSG